MKKGQAIGLPFLFLALLSALQLTSLCFIVSFTADLPAAWPPLLLSTKNFLHYSDYLNYSDFFHGCQNEFRSRPKVTPQA